MDIFKFNPITNQLDLTGIDEKKLEQMLEATAAMIFAGTVSVVSRELLGQQRNVIVITTYNDSLDFGTQIVPGITLLSRVNVEPGMVFVVETGGDSIELGLLEQGDQILITGPTDHDTLSATVIQGNISNAVTAPDSLTVDQVILGSGGRSVRALPNGVAGKVLTIAPNGQPYWADPLTMVQRKDSQKIYLLGCGTMGVSENVVQGFSNVLAGINVYAEYGIVHANGFDGILHETSWSDLCNLRDTDLLIPGNFYRITDYQCTTTQIRTQAADHAFDIIVLALATDKLSEDAWAINHAGDSYFASSKLESWRLKYCLDNDSNRFAWADTSNGKGVIYYLRDEFGNEAPYDFKNMMFARYPVTSIDYNGSSLYNSADFISSKEQPVFYGTVPGGYQMDSFDIGTSNEPEYYYTYTLLDFDDGLTVDASLSQLLNPDDDSDMGCKNNSIGRSYVQPGSGDYVEGLQTLNNIVVVAVKEDGYQSPMLNNTFALDCMESTVGLNSVSIDVKSNGLGIMIAANCMQITVQGYSLIIGGNSSDIRLKKCGSIGVSGDNLEISNSEQILCCGSENVVINQSSYIDVIESEKVDIYQSSSITVNAAINIKVESDCSGIQFGSHNENIKVEPKCINIQFGDYNQKITVGLGAHDFSIASGQARNIVQNCVVMPGAYVPTTVGVAVINFTAGVSYTQYAGVATNGTLNIFNPAD